MIHKTAVINPKAEIDTDVEIGPYSIIEEKTRIGSGTVIGPHVVIDKYTEIGKNCKIYQYASVGAPPQDLTYKGEETFLKVGDGSVIREFVTIHRGTSHGTGITEIGKDNYLMAYTHIAHDCKTGRSVILANNATLAGHVVLGDCVTLGGLVGIHQFVHIGDYAFIGGKSAVVKDVPPFVIAVGERAKLHGLNNVGLKRNNFTKEAISALKKVYRLIFRSGLTLEDAIQKVKTEVDNFEEVDQFINFIKFSQRGITR